MIRGIASGYWNPIHGGHIDYLSGSKAQCDWLIAIVNNDYQVKLKGSVPFMDQDHRKYIVSSIRYVDEVIISYDVDRHVCITLEFLRGRYPSDDLVFFNSGDRKTGNTSTAESAMCQKLQIKEVILNQEKRYSSRELLKGKV